MKVSLEVLNGPYQGHVMEFREPRGFVIGRAKDADFRLPQEDPYVSRRHVFLEICPPTCRLRNLGGKNPPHVNDSPFEDRALKNGDIIELGYTRFKVCIDSEIEAADLRPGQGDQHKGGLIARLFGWKDARENPAPPKPKPASKSAGPPRCGKCAADLTSKANSDGRATELQNIAIYRCEKHVPKGDRFKGTEFGSYEVCRRLGKGGMGVVFLVYHRDTARVLALKRINDVKDKRLAKRFEREMRLLKDIVHENVVRSIDTGIDAGGAPFVVTEYVPDGSLEDYVSSNGGRLPLAHAVELIGSALRGLEFIHAHSIVHRDIKPDNILLRFRSPGRNAITKLADFGLAVSYARGGGTRFTKPSIGMGTLMFTPPEQWRDARNVTPTADIYAMGVSLYYLLTGQYSFDFPSPREIAEFHKQGPNSFKGPEAALQALMRLRRINHPIQIVLSEDPIPIRERDCSLPQDLASVVDRAVRKDATKRHQSATEFRRALERAVE